jgi:formiminotetrahydrofolate cyclodeaminase
VAEAKLAKEKLEAAAKQVQDRLKEDNNLRGELQAQIDENQRLQDQINAGMNTPKHSTQAPPQSDAQKAAEAAVDPLVQWGQNVQQ